MIPVDQGGGVGYPERQTNPHREIAALSGRHFFVSDPDLVETSLATSLLAAPMNREIDPLPAET
jgi:hypothetical protein